jgi:phage terminase large subunit-like protein
MDRVTKYAASVVNGKIDRMVGKTEILCCKRHLRDIERAGTPEFPYILSQEKVNHIIDFAETLTLAEGDEPRPLRLYGFQDFVFGSWNGWVHKDTGRRRFRTSYMRVARQNGKSIGNAVPALYYGNFAGYQYPQIYTTATKELQARIVLKECIKFINSDKELSGTKTRQGLFTIKEYASKIDCNLTHGEIRALGRDTESIDGFRPYFGSVDEYHKHKTNQMYKLLVDGDRDMAECLVSVITTAGFDLNCPCKELDDYCHNVLAGVVDDETQFIYIAELDKEDLVGDGIWNEDNWSKANPLWSELMLRNMRADAIKARQMGGEELRNFMTKSLNIWVQLTDHEYIPPEQWAECATDMTLEDMRGRECYLGLDLSSGGDLTSGALDFPMDIKGEKMFFVDSHSFMPEKRLAEHIKTDHAPYDMWVKEGLITLTQTLGGIKTDYKYIIAYYKKLIADFDLKLMGVAYDPHNADAFLSDLEEFGVDCTSITQSARSLNDATVDFKLLVEGKQVLYDKRNKLLTWSFVNAQTTSNSFGEIKIDKDLTVKRIDPCDAVIDAHKLALAGQSSKQIDVNDYLNDGTLDRLWGV